MDLQTAYQEIMIRCYEWVLEDFQREIDQDYPYLRTVAERRVQSWIVLFEGLDNEQKRILSRLLVKRKFREVAPNVGASVTAEEEAICKQFASTLPVLPRKAPDPNKGDVTPINVRRLASRIIECLNPILGEQLEHFNEMEWAYVTPMGDWSVKTRVSIYNPQKPEIRYVHRVSHKDYTKPPVMPWLRPSYSFACNLGLGENVWRVDYEYELESMADSLATLCAHFIDAFPRLVQGLSPDEAVTVTATPISNTDFLLRYTREQDELTRQILHGVKKNAHSEAAWMPVLQFATIPDLTISVAVSDMEYEALSASMDQRKRFVQSIGREPILLYGDFDMPLFFPVPKTQMVVLYAGHVAPHFVNYRWWPRSIASVPTEGYRVLFDKFGLLQTDQYLGDNESSIYDDDTPVEATLRACSWFWIMLFIELGPSLKTAKCPLSSTWSALNRLEVSLNSLVTHHQDYEQPTAFGRNLDTARELTARGAFLTDQLRLREIDAPSADIFDQMNRLIDLVGDVWGSQTES